MSTQSCSSCPNRPPPLVSVAATPVASPDTTGVGDPAVGGGVEPGPDTTASNSGEVVVVDSATASEVVVLTSPVGSVTPEVVGVDVDGAVVTVGGVVVDRGGLVVVGRVCVVVVVGRVVVVVVGWVVTVVVVVGGGVTSTEPEAQTQPRAPC